MRFQGSPHWLATALRSRFSGRLRAEHRGALDRALDSTWLAYLGARNFRGLSTTVGMEFCLLHARLWMEYMRMKSAIVSPKGAIPSPTITE